MGFIKRNWFKVLILLPVVPALLFIWSLESFIGMDESVRVLAGLIVIATTLLLLFLGFYLEFGKGDFANKKIVFHYKETQFGIVEIGRVVFSVFAIGFFVAVFYVTSISWQLGEILGNVAHDPTTSRDYSLVTMADFDLNTQNAYNRIGVLAITDDEKSASLEHFLYEQDFILNPVQVTFSSPLALIEALYAYEVEAIIINSNFIFSFDDVEGLEFIEYDTVVLSYFTVAAVVVERDDIDPGEPFSILLLGLNTREEISTGAGQINTFMLLTVNLQDLSFTITSIPRDSYVWIPCFGNYDRLSHTNWGGPGCAVGAIENMFGIDIPYHVMLNFTGFMEIVDVLGGIYVDIPFRIIEQDSHRRFGENLIIIEPGLQLLNAEEALAFSRHRNSRGNTQMTGDDFARVGHQQIVLQAMLSRMFTQAAGINDLVPMLRVLGRNVQTNLHSEEIMAVADYLLTMLLQNRHVSGGIMNNLHFTNRVIRGDNAAVRNMSVVLPWPSEIAEAKSLMLINLGLLEPEFAFSFSFDGFNPPVPDRPQLGSYGTGRVPPGSVVTEPPQEDVNGDDTEEEPYYPEDEWPYCTPWLMGTDYCPPPVDEWPYCSPWTWGSVWCPPADSWPYCEAALWGTAACPPTRFWPDCAPWLWGTNYCPPLDDDQGPGGGPGDYYPGDNGSDEDEPVYNPDDSESDFTDS